MSRKRLKWVLSVVGVVGLVVFGILMSYALRRAESNHFAREREREEKSNAALNAMKLEDVAAKIAAEPFPEETRIRFVVDLWIRDDPSNPNLDQYAGSWASPEINGAKNLAQLIKFLAIAHGINGTTRRTAYIYVRDIMNKTWCKPSGTPVSSKNSYTVELDVRSGDIRE